ncbi:MAG: hypothetical protein ACT4P5_07495, partial [Armatimonadota bacterium]
MDALEIASGTVGAPASRGDRLLRHVEAEERVRQQGHQRNTQLGLQAFGVVMLLAWELASGPIL